MPRLKFDICFFGVTSTSKGFTLFEVLIVVGLIAVFAGVGLVIGIDAYERSTFRGQQDFLVSALHTARSRALANIGQCSHGVRIEEKSYTVFVEEDGVCDTESIRNETIEVEGGVVFSGPNEIVFKRVSGDVVIDEPEVTVTLTDADMSGDENIRISIGQNGRISWE